MDQNSALTPDAAPCFARAFVGFLSSFTLVTAAMVALGGFGA